MRKFTLSLGLLLAATAYAGDYKYLVFETTEGGSQSVGVDALEMTVREGKLVAANALESKELDLAALSKMYFSTLEVTSVGTASSAEAREVTVCDLSGRRVGSFASLEAARKLLPKGGYVVRQHGNNLKMAVR